MTELKPCPFCRGKATMYENRHENITYGYSVVCDNCCATVFADTEEEAIEAWNKRVPPTTKEIEEYIEKTHKENMEMVEKLKRKYEVES